MQIAILEPKDFSLKAIEALEAIGTVSKCKTTDIDNFISDKEVLFIRLAHAIDKAFLDEACKLKFICTPTTGLNHIDLTECKKRNIQIISLKGEVQFLTTIRATPEHTFGLTLTLLRNYKKAFLSKNNTTWDRDKHKGFELYNNHVGVIGFGRVGAILAQYFKAFDSSFYFYDINDKIQEKNGAKKLSSIEELIDKSNIVIMAASYTPESHHFFSKKHIDLLKGKYFINIARGELIDEKYLLKKIQTNFFKGVAIDVIENEQAENNLTEILDLTASHNLVVTPHIAGATFSSMHRTEEFIVEKLHSYTK